MAALNTSTSIVDYLKSTGQASDFNSRAALAAKNGITNYTGTAAQNTQLLSLVSKPAATVSTPAATTVPKTTSSPTSDPNAYINQNQQQDFNSASQSGQPSTRTSVQSYQDIYDNLTKSLTANLPSKPDPVNLTQTYQNLRTQYGVDDLEKQVTDLNSTIRGINSQLYTQQLDEEGKPVAMNVISGRMTEEQRQATEKLLPLQDQLKTLTDQLTSKYNVIDNLMKYTGQDYTNAKDAYDTAFSQNLSTMNAVKGIADSQISQQEQQNDDARANLQIIYNSLNANNVDPSTLDDTQKANITKLELQAGLPQGFYQNVVDKNPKADVLSTTTRESGGKKYADVILRNKDGSLSTQSIYLGASSSGSGGKPTEAELQRSAISNMGKDLQALAGADGYVSPADYKKGKQNWISAGFSGKDYDAAFQSYANPESYSDLGLSY